MLSKRTLEICQELVEHAEYVAGCVDDGISPRLRELWKAREELAALTPQPDAPKADSAGWIPVDKSLPEEYAWVLVYADGAIGCMGYVPGRGFEDWTLQQAPNVVIREITHWRHLPSGPPVQSRRPQEPT